MCRTITAVTVHQRRGIRECGHLIVRVPTELLRVKPRRQGIRFGYIFRSIAVYLTVFTGLTVKVSGFNRNGNTVDDIAAGIFDAAVAVLGAERILGKVSVPKPRDHGVAGHLFIIGILKDVVPPVTAVEEICALVVQAVSNLGLVRIPFTHDEFQRPGVSADPDGNRALYGIGECGRGGI